MIKYKRNRCTALKADGSRCKTFVLKGEPHCVWHSNSERGIRARKKKPVLSNSELAEILTRELNRVRKMKTKGRPLQKAMEVRKLVTLIIGLCPNKKSDEKIVGAKPVPTFQEKVQKAKKRKERDK